MAIEQGAMLPAIDLAGPDGSRIDLRSYLGAPLVVYFYPRDDTPGCTREAQDFSRLAQAFAQAGVAILGISKDSPAKHRKFIARHGLEIDLASDDSDAAMAAFDVWIEKSLYGKKYMGIERATFLFDARGRLVRSWRGVKVAGHAEQVLTAANLLG